MMTEGRAFDDAYYGRWSVSLVVTPGTVRVRRIGTPAGGVARLVTGAAALVEVLPSRVALALDRTIVGGRFHRTVHKGLRGKVEPDADAPNIIRIV
jgi:hypothetical protein